MGGQANRVSRRKAIVSTVLCIWIVGAIAALVINLIETNDELLDLQIYRMGGRALLDGEALYSVRYHVAGLPFTYTPFAAMGFAPFALLDTLPAAIIWTTLSLVALLRVCYLVAREANGKRPEWSVLELTLLCFAAALTIEPVSANLGFGQINLFILWLVVEDMLRERPRRFGGSLIGIATGIKLVPGLFIVFLFLTRRTREGLQAAGVALATVAVGFFVQSEQAWHYWTGIAYDPSRVGGVAFVSNQSINGVLTRLTQPGGNRPVWFVLAMAATGFCLWVGRHHWHEGNHLIALATIALGTLLVSPVSWSHHWVWLIVVLAALIVPIRDHVDMERVDGESHAGRPALSRWVLVAAVLAAATTRVIWSVPNTGDQEYDWVGWQLVAGNAYAIVSIGFLVYAFAATRTDVTSIAKADRVDSSGGGR